MDKSDKTARAEGRVKDDFDNPDDPTEDTKPQAVTVKFSRVSITFLFNILHIYYIFFLFGRV